MHFIALSAFYSKLLFRMAAEYSTSPELHTVSSKIFKNLHLCHSLAGDCYKKNPNNSCFKKVYEQLDSATVYHYCTDRCDFAQRYP